MSKLIPMEEAAQMLGMSVEQLTELLAEDFERHRVELAVDVILIPEAPGSCFPSRFGARPAEIHVDVVPSLAKVQLVVREVFRGWSDPHGIEERD